LDEIWSTVSTFIFIHQNGREKYNDTKTIQSERKMEANNSTK